MSSRIKSVLDKPTFYYVIAFALATGFFQAGFGLVYHEYLFHLGRDYAIPLWVAANLAQFVGIIIYAVTVFFWPKRATSVGTLCSLALIAIAAAGATAASYGSKTLLVAGGLFLATVAAMTGFVLVGISRHASPRKYGQIVSAGLGIGMIVEFINSLLIGEANPSLISWSITALIPLAMYYVYRIGFNRVFFDIERTITTPSDGERRSMTLASLPNIVVLFGAAGLMKLISLLGIVRPKLVAPDIIDQYPFIQASIILGVIAVGPLMDRSRRAGAVATVSSLTIAFVAVAFMQLADSSALWAGQATYSIGYLMVGSTVAFSVIACLDLASRSRSLLPFAIGGMVIHSGIEAAVMGIPDSVIANPTQSATLLAVLFAVVVPLSSLMKNRLWPPLLVGDRIVNQPPGELVELSIPANDSAAGNLIAGNLEAAVAADSGSVSVETDEAPAAQNRVILTSPEQRLHDFGSRFNLSLRERELLLELLDGHSNAQIATRLYISESTVKFHVRNILDKTGCDSRVEVINLYWRTVM